MILGREPLIEALWKHAVAGHTVLIYGPVGIGKSTLLDALAARAAANRRPCGRSAQTATLSDVTQALANAYPHIDGSDLSQRRLRGRLRLAVELEPGLLLLDDLREAGTALKGFLRGLRGTGLGVLLAGDVEHPRDHDHLRELALSYREVKVPPLAARYMARMLDDALVGQPSHGPLTDDDRSSLLRAAAGRPGWLFAAAQLLREPSYFSGDRARLEILRSDIAVATSKRLMQTVRASWR